MIFDPGLSIVMSIFDCQLTSVISCAPFFPAKKAPAANPMSREELERHLEAKQTIFSDIEKAPALLPMEIFSNDNSNLDR